MTYSEAYDKIIQAYYKDEIRPLNSEFCFCGTLHGTSEWNAFYQVEMPVGSPYTLLEYKEMEKALFVGILQKDFRSLDDITGALITEDALFNGMCYALDVLKKIHISRGEVIDEPVEFKKRRLIEAILK